MAARAELCGAEQVRVGVSWGVIWGTGGDMGSSEELWGTRRNGGALERSEIIWGSRTRVVLGAKWNY